LLVESKVVKTMKFNTLGLGYAGAIVAALLMLLIGILGNLGIYTSAMEMMMQWHGFFSLSAGGIVLGMVEAAVWTFVTLYIFGWVYNKIA
jgi:hypothetical protein